MSSPFPITLKTKLFFILLILTIIGVIKNGFLSTFPQIIIAVITATVLDLTINYLKNKKIIFPDSAIISGLFIATALSINSIWYIPFSAAVFAIIIKHVIKINNKHIFNPAVSGLFFVMLLFQAKIEWWSGQILWLVIIFGIYLMYKMKNYFLISSYLIIGIGLAIMYNLVNNQNLTLSTIFFSTNFFFMFFMLVEPITAPFRKKAKIIYGTSVAIISFLILIFIPQFESSITTLIIANLFVPLLNKLN